ncbi:uncharacterized protein PHACADRAFT_198097 [Phanerochaete carnosa HHB-10118-sp]|uniref:Cyclopropane-fatty-acyl-phospholipid synthase n=1 Tax=Phanerochaete carnosa (strain HHB-10118-sp) TaxID=650164 RepID=K5W3G4_PHACS|nr:uncharacterized protein PHACADRAFT_198097 [Phanerochaete carnosa HHB-10118-sp]EKM53675.1 hypothetical protein PHACADRAFT_198097 [Phanerochaete carnosa HHB-10118-sp]
MSAILYDAAEAAFAWYLSRTITRGRLTLHTRTRTHCFPTSLLCAEDSELGAELTVHDPAFFLKVLSPAASPDLVFAEAYMRGDVSFKSRRDMARFFEIFAINRDNPLPSLPVPISSMLAIPGSLLKIPARIIERLVSEGTLAMARRNTSAHYDLGNDMFKVFLSKDMTYSCAIFPSLDADDKLASNETSPRMGSNVVNGTSDMPDALHDAQIRKLQHIICKADIQPGHRVLEIGSGWGSLALEIVRTIPGTTVDTITLSTEQAEYIHALLRQERQERLRDTGHCMFDYDAATQPIGDRVRVHLMDFRVMPQEWAGAFDRVVSVEMIEAIGRDMYETYFAAIDWALKKDTGVGVVQAITIPEGRYDAYIKGEDFIRKYSLSQILIHPSVLAVFPGGVLPTLTQLTHAVVSGSSQRLVIDSVANIGPHYARTLREWRQRFEAGFRDVENALKAKYPDVMNDTPAGREEIARFRRKWIYYFCYCEAGFSRRVLGDHIITFIRDGNVAYGCQIFA